MIGWEVPGPPLALLPVLVPSKFKTSTALRPSAAVGLRLTIAVIRPLLTTVVLRTATSVARVRPLDWLRLGSGGEITTVAPGRKFEPTRVIWIRLPDCAENSGDELIRIGAGAAVTASGTAFEVSPTPPAASGLNTVIWRLAGVTMSVAKIVAVICSALLNTVGRLLPLT